MMSSDMVSVTKLNAWQKWIKINKSRCHLNFGLGGNSIPAYIEGCIDSSRSTVARVAADLSEDFMPRRILEIGASVGFNALALAERFEGAEVYSLELDAEAVEVATSMAADFGLPYKPVYGFGEKLDYPDRYFDLIICYTVIEHVTNVHEVIAEIARVLSENGAVQLEAPNYLWPYDPYLEVWCIPLMG